MDNLFANTKNKIEELRSLKTPYQIAKDMNVSKATLYRLFEEEGLGKVKFETIIKLMGYRNKTLKENQSVFDSRDERIYVLHQINQQQLLWTGLVESEILDLAPVNNGQLRQPDIDFKVIEYGIYKFLPSLQSEGAKFYKDSEYLAEVIHEVTKDAYGNNKVKIGVLVTNLETREEIIKDFIVEFFIDERAVGYENEWKHIIYLFEMLIALYLEDKSLNHMDLMYYVMYPSQTSDVTCKFRKPVPTQIGGFELDGANYEDTDDIIYELEKLVEGKPYANSVANVLMKKQGYGKNDEELVVLLDVSLETHEYGGKYYLFLKTYLFNEVNSIQLIKVAEAKGIVVRKMESLKFLLKESYQNCWSEDNDIQIAEVVCKNFI